MEQEKNQRDYKKEVARNKEINKLYTVKVPRYTATLLDEKLKKEKKTFTGLVKEAIEKYLKKN